MSRAMHTTSARNSTVVCRGLELLERDTSLARYAFSLCLPTRGCFSCCPNRRLYCSTGVSVFVLFLPIMQARRPSTRCSRARIFAHAHTLGYEWACSSKQNMHASVFISLLLQFRSGKLVQSAAPLRLRLSSSVFIHHI